MNNKQAIQTSMAPMPIGVYSQAIRVNNTLYVSGQIPLDPHSGELREGNIESQAKQVFDNLSAVINAADFTLNQCVKLTIFLMDLADFSVVNQVMAEYFQPPYPARSTIQVAALPKKAKLEIEAILVCP